MSRAHRIDGRVPQIVVMNNNNKLNSGVSGVSGAPCEKKLAKLKITAPGGGGSMMNSPEITCSPSPCVFDAQDANAMASCRYLKRSPSPSPSPGADWRRRRSLSPFGHSPTRRGSLTPSGYEQYQKSLLEVPFCTDFADASSDDLSSEWDSDVPDTTHNKTKVTI